eukprot:COSAG05_NODE_927_length_6569_cov_13.038485_7_plen_64_part_00
MYLSAGSNLPTRHGARHISRCDGVRRVCGEAPSGSSRRGVHGGRGATMVCDATTVMWGLLVCL